MMGIMCRIRGTWYDPINVNTTVKEYGQHRKNKNYLDCWRIVPVTVDQSCKWLLSSLPVNIEQSCQWLLNNRVGDCWQILSTIVKQLCQQLLNNRTSDCWTIKPATFEGTWQQLLKNYSWTIVPVSVEQYLASEQSCLASDCQNLCLWRFHKPYDCRTTRLWLLMIMPVTAVQ